MRSSLLVLVVFSSIYGLVAAQALSTCPIHFQDTISLLNAIDNYRVSSGLRRVNVSYSLMTTACAHLRDISSHDDIVNQECGLHSWSSCCYPVDNSNPSCMHRKPLQVTMALGMEHFNVAGYELAYKWTDSFSALRAIGKFASNQGHADFLLQRGVWSDYVWNSMGATVGDHIAYLWFSVKVDPNGEFPSFETAKHANKLAGCTCSPSSPAEKIGVVDGGTNFDRTSSKTKQTHHSSSARRSLFAMM